MQPYCGQIEIVTSAKGIRDLGRDLGAEKGSSTSESKH